MNVSEAGIQHQRKSNARKNKEPPRESGKQEKFTERSEGKAKNN